MFRWRYTITVFIGSASDSFPPPLRDAKQTPSLTTNNVSGRKVEDLTPTDLRTKMYYLFLFWSLLTTEHPLLLLQSQSQEVWAGREKGVRGAWLWQQEEGGRSKSDWRMVLYDRKHGDFQSKYSKFRELPIFQVFLKLPISKHYVCQPVISKCDSSIHYGLMSLPSCTNISYCIDLK